MINKASALNTLSLFSGGGGLDLGFAAASFSIVAAMDIDPYSCETLQSNHANNGLFHKPIVINKDIYDFSANNLLVDHKIDPKNINVVIGGPPCQAFSVFGRRGGLKDPRGHLVWEYIRILKEIDPQVFVFENVAGIKTIHSGELYSNLMRELSCDGVYEVSDHSYDVAEYGIPQHRQRVFFIGIKGQKIPQMNPTHGDNTGLFPLNPYVTAGVALKGLDEMGKDSKTPNHIGRNHSQRIIDRYKSLKFGERDHKTRINKLDPCRPSFTIIVGSDAGGGKGHVHPYSPREVTPRESARMQTFPDWWAFSGTGRHVIRQVGNAVPPLFAALLAEHISSHVWKTKRLKSYSDFLDILKLDYLKDAVYDN